MSEGQHAPTRRNRQPSTRLWSAVPSAAARSRRAPPPATKHFLRPCRHPRPSSTTAWPLSSFSGILAAAMATTTDDAYVYQVPAMTPGVGLERSVDSTGSTSSGNWPEHPEITPISRTVAEDRVVDEIPLSLTHDIETDQLPPAVPPN
jgi:hypothetical protein